MPDELVSLKAERAHVNELLEGPAGTHVALPVAAAITFDQAHGSTRAIVTRQDYDEALNIAAAALSRLIPVYQVRDAKEEWVPVAVDLTRQRFARGATELRDRGRPLARELFVRFADLKAAIALVKSAGLTFSLAMAPELPADPGQAARRTPD